MIHVAPDFSLAFVLAGEDAMTGDTDKYLGPQDLKELGDDSLPAEGYMGFSLGARSARYSLCCFSCLRVTAVELVFTNQARSFTQSWSLFQKKVEGVYFCVMIMLRL